MVRPSNELSLFPMWAAFSPFQARTLTQEAGGLRGRLSKAEHRAEVHALICLSKAGLMFPMANPGVWFLIGVHGTCRSSS